MYQSYQIVIAQLTILKSEIFKICEMSVKYHLMIGFQGTLPTEKWMKDGERYVEECKRKTHKMKTKDQKLF